MTGFGQDSTGIYTEFPRHSSHEANLYGNEFVSGLRPSSEILEVVILDFQTMDKVQKPIASQCYIPSSKHFKTCMGLIKYMRRSSDPPT